MGRKPAGPRLVNNLPGSRYAKKRLKVILQQMAGEISIREACEKLGIEKSAFHKLRSRLLGDMVESLEPRPAGRPPIPKPDTQELDELQDEVTQLKRKLKAAEVREELATVLQRVTPPKKTRWKRK